MKVELDRKDSEVTRLQGVLQAKEAQLLQQDIVLQAKEAQLLQQDIATKEARESRQQLATEGSALAADNALLSTK